MVYEFNRAPMSGSTFHSDRQRFKGSSDPPQNRRTRMLKNYKNWVHYKKDIAEIERMLKALIKSLENEPLNP